MTIEVLTYLMPLKSKMATKKFKWNENEWKLFANYQAGKLFKGFEIGVNDLQEAHKYIKENQDYPAFLIHGKFKKGTDLTKPIVRRKRSDHKDEEKPTIEDRKLTLVCFDIDGASEEHVEIFINHQLPKQFHSADYIYQFSASYGLTSQKLKVHLFFWLSKPIWNTDIKEWVKNYNKQKEWGNILDDSIYTCTQPIYTQKRICIGKDDPIQNFIGIVTKKGALNFDFSVDSIIRPPAKTTSKKYDLAAGIEKILTSENYHEELNKLALSLINKNIPPDTVKSMLEGAMNAAKRQITDKERLDTWEIRFQDITRSVDSAVEIVDNPTLDELLEWINDTDEVKIRIDFAKKCLNLNPVDLKMFTEELDKKIKVGIRNIYSTVKLLREKKDKEYAQKEKEKLSSERAKKNIYEIEITLLNSEIVCEKVCKVLSKSKNGVEVFKVPGNLAFVGEGMPKTIRQVTKKHELGEDYPKMPIINLYKRPFYDLSARVERDVVFFNTCGKEIEITKKILHIIGSARSKEFRPLTGIVEHPFVDNNFNIIQENGYNSETGLYTILHDKLKLKIINAKEAYEYLAYTVFDEFPFTSDLDRAVAVSSLLTCIQRPVIAGDSGMPGFGITSPIQSSGKTTLAQLISYSIYNRAVAATNFSHDDEELSKHMLAILREGHSCVLFDNIPQSSDVKSDVLAKAMSSDVFGGRQLGENQTIEVPSSVIWLFTGNSIRFVGDFATRIYPININPNMENPDIRKFKRPDIGQWAIDNRKHIISALISIIVNCRESIEMKSSSRFKLWDRFIRQPLFKITQIDVNQAILENKKSDSVLRAKKNLLSQLWENFTNTRFTTKELILKAYDTFDQGKTDLADALEDLIGKKSRSSRSVGRYLSGLVDVVLGQYALRREDSNVIYWIIEKK